jgi:hypothetical protein
MLLAISVRRVALRKHADLDSGSCAKEVMFTFIRNWIWDTHDDSTAHILLVGDVGQPYGGCFLPPNCTIQFRATSYNGSRVHSPKKVLLGFQNYGMDDFGGEKLVCHNYRLKPYDDDVATTAMQFNGEEISYYAISHSTNFERMVGEKRMIWTVSPEEATGLYLDEIMTLAQPLIYLFQNIGIKFYWAADSDGTNLPIYDNEPNPPGYGSGW